MKTCSTCNQEKNETEFTPFNSECAECKKAALDRYLARRTSEIAAPKCCYVCGATETTERLEGIEENYLTGKPTKHICSSCETANITAAATFAADTAKKNAMSEYISLTDN
jgi:hypothetical protein